MRSRRGYMLVGLVFLFAALIQAWSASARLLPDVGGGVDVHVPPGYQVFKVPKKGENQVDLEHFNWVGILPAISVRANPFHIRDEFHIDDKIDVDGVDLDSKSASASTHTKAQGDWN